MESTMIFGICAYCKHFEHKCGKTGCTEKCNDDFMKDGFNELSKKYFKLNRCDFFEETGYKVKKKRI